MFLYEFYQTCSQVALSKMWKLCTFWARAGVTMIVLIKHYFQILSYFGHYRSSKTMSLAKVQQLANEKVFTCTQRLTFLKRGLCCKLSLLNMPLSNLDDAPRSRCKNPPPKASDESLCPAMQNLDPSTPILAFPFANTHQSPR